MWKKISEIDHPLILHVTPHLGGGLGAVLRAWVLEDAACRHMIATLDYANDWSKKELGAAGIPLYDQPSAAELDRPVQAADIVLVHFWNHPLLYDWLARPHPAARLAIWTHIAGLTPPNLITPEIAGLPDELVLTTPISRACPALRGRDVPFIWSTSGIQRMLDLQPLAHEGLAAGYVGTVDFAKMHPDYIRVHEKLPADRFLIVGGEDVAHVRCGADERFVFPGRVDDVRPYLAQMDIFAYLLNPRHFGTCEQALQEAMAAGVPPVVLGNPCEASIVRDGETGLVARDLEEYVRDARRLLEEEDLRRRLAACARAYAAHHFSMEEMVQLWHAVFCRMMAREKRLHRWPAVPEDAFALFCMSIGKEAAGIFCSGSKKEIQELLQKPEWQSASKGTPKQWCTFLGGARLEALCELYGR